MRPPSVLPLAAGTAAPPSLPRSERARSVHVAEIEVALSRNVTRQQTVKDLSHQAEFTSAARSITRPSLEEVNRVSRALMRDVVQNNDHQAFAQLVLLLRGFLWACAQRLVASAYVEDLVQETLMRAWTSRRTYRGDALPLTWLRTIMAHEAARDRRLRPSPSQVNTDDLAAVAGPEELVRFEVADAIDRALERLTPRQAALVRQRHLAEQDWESICASLGYDSPRHAQRALQEAMARLAELHQVPAHPHPSSSTGEMAPSSPRPSSTPVTRRRPPSRHQLDGDNGR